LPPEEFEMDVRVLLICHDQAALAEYQKALTEMDIAFDSVFTLAALESRLIEKQYNGLLLDLETMSRAAPSEKDIAKDLLDLFPVIRLRWDAEKHKIRTIFYGEFGDGTLELADFLEQHCKPFKKRSIRRCVRRPIHFNVLACSDREFAPATVRWTNTIDVSEDGCFLYAGEDWAGCEEVWLKVQELGEEPAILGHVRWATPWGTALQLPGVGLEFDEITSSQREEIKKLIFPFAGKESRPEG